MRRKREAVEAARQAAEERSRREAQAAAATKTRRAEGTSLAEARRMLRTQSRARLRGRFNWLSGVTALALAAFALRFGAWTAWMNTEVPTLGAVRGDTSAAQRAGSTGVEPAPPLRLDEDVSAFGRGVDAIARSPAISSLLRAKKEPDTADAAGGR